MRNERKYGFRLRFVSWVLLPGILLLSGAVLTSCARRPGLYAATFFDVFDTVTTIKVVAKEAEAAQETIADVHKKLQSLDRAFDIYEEKEKNNLKTVNNNAGNGVPVPVTEDILELLTLGQAAYDLSGGRVNICLGAVLKLWHEARTDGGYIPAEEALAAAAEHTDISTLVVDREAGTVCLTDPAASLDVGAIAKGYAAYCVRRMCLEKMTDGSISGLVLDLGGHVLALGETKDATPWQIGIRDPRTAGQTLTVWNVPEGDDTAGASVVTSGVDQRNFTVDGVRYHHLIDPETGMPGMRYLSVSVYVPTDLTYPVGGEAYDSTMLADALSTALFLMSPEDGQAILAGIPGARCVWMDREGNTTFYH